MEESAAAVGLAPLELVVLMREEGLTDAVEGEEEVVFGGDLSMKDGRKVL